MNDVETGHCMKTSRFTLFIVLVLFTGCSSPIHPPASLPPTPVLRPALTFVEGKAEIPPDQYLFVEYFIDKNGSGSCSYGYGDSPTYYYDAGKLHLRFPPTMPLSAVKGFFGDGNGVSGALGSGGYSTMHFIDTFPYRTPAVIIHSVDAQGTIVAEVNKQTFFLEAGQSWRHIIEETSDPKCRIVITHQFTNHGLLTANQIETQ